MKKQRLNRSQVIDLATILYNVRDHVSYVAEKYIKAPLQINRDYRKIGSKKPKIRSVSQQSKTQHSVDIARIESIAYYSLAILDFINVIETRFPDDVLDNFYRNINTLRVEKVNNVYKYLNDSSGVYLTVSNRVGVKKSYIYTIYHELFHMASTKVFKNVVCCGFSIYEQKKSIGVGLNEGYTELLANRYFRNGNTVRFLRKNYSGVNVNQVNDTAYPLQVLIASKLEEIVGKEKMERLYLGANLNGLVRELQQYVPKEAVHKFISNVDFLHNNINNFFNFSLKSEKIHNVYVEVCNFLDTCYRKKLDARYPDDIERKKILRSRYMNDLSNYYDEYFSWHDDKKNKKK